MLSTKKGARPAEPECLSVEIGDQTIVISGEVLAYVNRIAAREDISPQEVIGRALALQRAVVAAAAEGSRATIRRKNGTVLELQPV